MRRLLTPEQKKRAAERARDYRAQRVDPKSSTRLKPSVDLMAVVELQLAAIETLCATLQSVVRCTTLHDAKHDVCTTLHDVVQPSDASHNRARAGLGSLGSLSQKDQENKTFESLEAKTFRSEDAREPEKIGTKLHDVCSVTHDVVQSVVQHVYPKEILKSPRGTPLVCSHVEPETGSRSQDPPGSTQFFDPPEARAEREAR